MVVVFVFNIYILFFHEKNAAKENEQLTKENQKLQQQVNEYKDKQKNISNTAREKYYNDLTEKADLFVELIFTQKPEGYQKRKDQAKHLLNDELLDKYFSPDKYTNDDVVASVSNKKFYIEEMDKQQEVAHVLAQTDHKTEYKNKDETQNMKVITRITFEREGDDWIATNSKNVYTKEEDNDE